MNLGPEFPVCLAGKRNAPPEDIGGFPMYQHIMKGFKSGKLEPDYRDFLGDYDPEYFDVDETNDVLSDPDALNEDYLSMF